LPYLSKNDFGDKFYHVIIFLYLNLLTMKKIILMIAILSFMMPATSFAASIMTGNNVNIKDAVSENIYVSGGAIDVGSPVNGDFVSIGGSIEIENDVAGSVLAAGGTINIAANVKGSVRAAGGQIFIKGNIDKDLLVFGGSVDIAENSVIGGDLIVYGGDIKINGVVHGNVYGNTTSFRLMGLVGGNVNIAIRNYARIADNARVNGDFIYTSSSIVYVPDNVVGGHIKRNESSKKWQEKGFLGITLGDIFSGFLKFLTLALIGLLISLFIHDEFNKTSALVKKSFWKYLGIGFLAMVAVPIASVILLFTIIGAPIGLIAGAMFLIMGYITKVFAGFFVGDLIIRKIGGKWHTWLKTVLGLTIITIVGFVPLIGWLAVFIVWLASFGAFIARKYQAFKFLEGKKFF